MDKRLRRACRHQIKKPHIIIFFGVLLSLCCESYAFSDGGVDKILEIWKERERRVRSAEFVWTETQTIPAGVVLSGKSRSAVTQRDETHDVHHVLRFRGEEMFYSTDGPLWDSAENTFVRRRYVSVHNVGKPNKAFFDEAGGKIHPVGFREDDTKIQDWNNDHILPILMTYRPLHSEAGRLNKAEWKLGKQVAILNGRPCSPIECTLGEKRYNCWVDSERGCVITRFLQYMRGELALQLDVSYEAKERGEWMPSRWTSMASHRGILRHSTSAIVTTASLNPPLQAKDLTFDFPPGTEVIDRSGGGKPRHYIVRKDGSERTITDEEQRRNTNYDQWVVTEPGKAGLPHPAPSHRWVMVGLGTLLLAVCIVYFTWKHLRKQAVRT